MIDGTDLAKIIIDMVLKNYGLSKIIIHDQKLILHLQVLVRAMQLLWYSAEAIYCILYVDKRLDQKAKYHNISLST